MRDLGLVWQLMDLYDRHGPWRALDPQTIPCGAVQELVQWLRSNHGALSASPLGLLLTEIQAAPIPEEHPQYWAAVQRAAVLGRSGDAQDLLGLHSGFARWSDPQQRKLVQPQVQAYAPPCLHTTMRVTRVSMH